MAAIQPYRYPEGTLAAGNMAANQGLTYRYLEGPPATSSMAAGIGQQFRRPEGPPLCPPDNMANPGQPYSAMKMDYFYPHLQAGVTEPVLVTQVWDAHRLYCQLRSMSHEVHRLSESMHHYYEVQKGYGDQGPQAALALGQPCASRGTDGRWYRSLLQELFLDKQLAMVIHVDWGRREIVSLSGLRNLAGEFFRMPVVTYPCTMYGISSGILGWDPAMLAEIRTILLGRHVSAKIECYNSYERLYVVTLFAEDGMNLNNFIGVRSQSPNVCQVNLPGVAEPLPVTEGNEKTVPREQAQPSPFSSKFPPVELKIGKFEDAAVEYVIDPFNFWIRLEKYAANYKEMVEGMTALCTQASKLEGIITQPTPGQLCCAKYQDLYYRAEVISVGYKKVKVYFLDNGISETVEWSDVKELHAKFTKLPGLANKCCIAETYPLEESWSREAILAFKVAVADKKFVIHVVSKDGDEYTIELMDQSRIEEKNVGKILAKAGLASFEELDSNCPSSDGKIASVESAKTALNPAAPDYVSKAQEPAASAAYEENTEASPFEEQLFEPGTTIEIVVSHVEHPGLFWCQNAGSKADLNTLMGAIQNHCMSTDFPYRSGDLICLARSPSDGIWHRAFITESPVNLTKTSLVNVLYVDYGKRETVPVANLRALNSEFFHLKSQAFKCSLYNIITPLGGNPFLWDNKATNVFMQFVQGASKWTEFHCIVYATASLNKELFNIVDLYTPFDSVCDTLVRSGYAAHLHHKSLTPSVQLQSYYYSKHDIKMGNDEEIYVTYVDSSLSFYAQLARAAGTLDQISPNITKAVKKAQKLKPPPFCGALCLAKFSDQQWYRGLIVSESESKEIFFVDYGNTETLSEEDLLPILPSEHELLLLPMQAVKCSLSDSPSKVPDEIVAWFEDTVLDKRLRAQIVEKDADGKLSVELYDGNLQINAALKGKLGLSVPKARLAHPAGDQPKPFKQDDSRKLPNNASHQERKTSFFVGKDVKSRESDIRSHSQMAQEPEPRSRKNPTFPHKAENKDRNSRFQEFSSQRKIETVQRALPGGSYQGSHGGRDAKEGGNKTLPQQRSCTLAADRQSPAKPPVVTLSDIPKRKILPGMREPVYVSHTNSVFDFYVQVTEDSQLDEMSEILNNEESSFEDLSDEDIRVGNVICARFPDDGLYYRGLVARKSRQGLCVEYIDYGNTSVLCDCRNYRLPQRCLSVPVMSIHCSLTKPKNALTSPNLQELLVEFSKRTSDVQLDCEFLKQDGPKWDVILKDELGCMNDLLTASEEPVPEKNIKEVSEMVTKMKIAKKEETSSVNAFTWNLPQPGDTVKVYASAADSPDCFWCQLSMADIDSLASQVQEAGEQTIKRDDFIGALKIGSPCNVIFSEDNNWYRAIVTRMEADLVTVRFIDYGNEDSVGRDQIKQLPDPLVLIPPQAFSCCLADFDMKARTWSSEGKNYFYEQVTEGALELTVCAIQECDSRHIPVASVTVTYNRLNINEEMRKFWEKVERTDRDLLDEPTNTSPAEFMEDQARVYRDSPAVDPGSNLGEDSNGDVIRPHHGEEQESDTDGVKDTLDLHHKVHVDPAGEDVDDAQDMDELGSYEVNMADDASPDPPAPVPREQGVAVESGHLQIAADHQFPDPPSSHPQDGTVQENAANEGVDVPCEDYVDAEHHLTTNDGEENEEASKSNCGIEETAFSEVLVTSEDLKECGHTLGKEALENNSFAASDDLDKAGWAAPSIKTQEGKTIDNIGIADEIVPSGISEIHKTEIIVTNEDVEESEAATDSDDVRGEDIVDNKVPAEPLEIAPLEDKSILQDETIKDVQSHGRLIYEGVTGEDDLALGFGDAGKLEIEDPLNGVAVTGGEEGPAGEDYIDIEAIHAEAFTGNEETVSADVAAEHSGTITSKDFVQSKEHLTSTDIMECGGVTTTESEVIQKDEDDISTEGAIEQGSIICVELWATIGEGSLNDFHRDFVASTSDQGLHRATEDIERGEGTTTDFEVVMQEDEEVVSPEEAIEEASISIEEFEATILEGPATDLSRDFVACASEEPVTGEEAVAEDDVETEAVAVEEVFCESVSTDGDDDHEEPELVLGSGESSQHVVDVYDQNEDAFPADDTDTKQRDTEQAEQTATEVTAEDVWGPTAKQATTEVTLKDVWGPTAKQATTEVTVEDVWGPTAMQAVTDVIAEDVWRPTSEQAATEVIVEDVWGPTAEQATTEVTLKDVWGPTVEQTATEVTAEDVWGPTAEQAATEVTAEVVWAPTAEQAVTEVTVEDVWGPTAEQAAAEVILEDVWGPTAEQAAAEVTFVDVWGPTAEQAAAEVTLKDVWGPTSEQAAAEVTLKDVWGPTAEQATTEVTVKDVWGPTAMQAVTDVIAEDVWRPTAEQATTEVTLKDVWGPTAMQAATEVTVEDVWGPTATQTVTEVIVEDVWGPTTEQAATEVIVEDVWGPTTEKAATEVTAEDVWGPTAEQTATEVTAEDVWGPTAEQTATEVTAEDVWGPTTEQAATDVTTEDVWAPTAEQAATEATAEDVWGPTVEQAVTEVTAEDVWGPTAEQAAAEVTLEDVWRPTAEQAAAEVTLEDVWGLKAEQAATEVTAEDVWGPTVEQAVTEVTVEDVWEPTAEQAVTEVTVEDVWGPKAEQAATEVTAEDVWEPTAEQAATEVTADDLWGPTAEQAATEATADNVWGPTVEQAATEVTVDDLWGPTAEQAATEVTPEDVWGPTAEQAVTEVTAEDVWGPKAEKAATEVTAEDVWGPKAEQAATEVTADDVWGPTAEQAATEATAEDVWRPTVEQAVTEVTAEDVWGPTAEQAATEVTLEDVWGPTTEQAATEVTAEDVWAPTVEQAVTEVTADDVWGPTAEQAVTEVTLEDVWGPTTEQAATEVTAEDVWEPTAKQAVTEVTLEDVWGLTAEQAAPEVTADDVWGPTTEQAATEATAEDVWRPTVEQAVTEVTTEDVWGPTAEQAVTEVILEDVWGPTAEQAAIEVTAEDVWGPTAEQAATEVTVEDVWEPTAEDASSDSDGKQPDSFTMYRECPTLIASTDSVYESEPPEKTDSDSEGPIGCADDLLWSYFCESESAVQENVVTEDDDCGDSTLHGSMCQTDDCDTEADGLGDPPGQDIPESDECTLPGQMDDSDPMDVDDQGHTDIPESDERTLPGQMDDSDPMDVEDQGHTYPEPYFSSSVEAEPSPVTAAAAEERRPEGQK